MIHKVRFFLDSVVEDYPSVSKYLAEDSNIVRNKDFDIAVFKVLRKKENELSACENRATSSCRLYSFTGSADDDDGSNESNGVSYLKQIESKRRRLENRAE